MQKKQISKKIIVIALVTLTIVIVYFFTSQKIQTSFLKIYRDKECNTAEIKKLQKALTDTIYAWANRNIRLAKRFNEDEWIVDKLVLFNKKHDRCIMFIYWKDKDPGYDGIDFIVAEEKNEIWNFYSGGLVTFGFEKNKETGKSYDFEVFAEKAIYEMVRGGYYYKFTWTVNYNYVDDWFNEQLYGHQETYLKDVEE